MKIINTIKSAGVGLLLLLGLSLTPALAGPCVTAAASVWDAPGFNCTVGTLLFSNFDVHTTGLVDLGNFSPFTTTGPNGHIENGFLLNYSANTNGINTSADVTLNYDVSVLAGAPFIIDAYMALTGGTGGDGARITLAETLSPNSVSLFLSGPGVVDKTFDPIGALTAIKDQNDFAGLTFATSSALVDAFSQCIPGTPGCVINPPVEVPEPASLAMFGTALLGFGAFAWMRRRRSDGDQDYRNFQAS